MLACTKDERIFMRAFRGKGCFCSLAACMVLVASLQTVVAGEKLPFANNSGARVLAVYAHAPGHESWKVAGPLDDGESARLETETLQGCRRLIVRFDDVDGNSAAEGGNILQYFNQSYFGGVEEIALAPDGDGTPRLVVLDDEEQYVVMPGLPFDILASHIETGVDKETYAGLMNPLQGDGNIPSTTFAVTFGKYSFRIGEGGVQFADSDGKEILSSLQLTVDLSGKAMARVMDALHRENAEPLLFYAGGRKLAFRKGGLELVDGASLIPGIEEKDFEDRWEALLENMEETFSEAFPENGIMHFVFAGYSVRYEIRVDFIDAEIDLDISKQSVAAVPEVAAQADGDATVDGLNILPMEFFKGTTFENGVVFPDGTWWQQRLGEDKNLAIEARRLKPVDFGEKGMRRLIRSMWSGTKQIRVMACPPLADKTSYPALEAHFLTGGNEDTRIHVATAVFTDDWTFITDVSYHASMVDQRSNAPDFTPDIIINEIEDFLFEAEAYSGPVPFGQTVKVYETENLLAAIEDDATPMNALINIKRIANPEGGLEDKLGRLVYRYDGLEMLSLHGLALHTYSFCTDLPEKFTAEKHYGAGKDGTVYVMNIFSGGKYEPIAGQAANDEKVPNWWGEYYQGNKEIRIGNYREGTDGNYFMFIFHKGEDELGSGMAMAEEREASYCGLMFVLSDDDATLAVSLDDDAELCSGDEAWLKECMGIYKR